MSADGPVVRLFDTEPSFTYLVLSGGANKFLVPPEWPNVGDRYVFECVRLTTDHAAGAISAHFQLVRI